MKESEEITKPESQHFIEQFIEKDLSEGKNDGRVHTRFPPEPNGYLHIGHAKAICLDFGMAEKYGGKCNLRFDDTNPTKEEVEYVDSIKEDIKWLGFTWEDREYYASDYFGKLWNFAVLLINRGLAYVDDQSAETIAEQKGTPTQPGTESPYRNRSIEENLDLFYRMNEGEFEEGSCVLRARIDMASPNLHMRDPIIYRILKTPHHRTGTTWKVYPMYDFAHGQSDYFEGITHSLCTLEFEVHRPLYDWFIDQLQTDDYRPRQIEFNRLNLTYTVMSKRKLLELVKEGVVSGWDDPRMPTLCGLRRRGYTPESVRRFVDLIGYTKVEAINDVSLLEYAVREDLNKRAPRVFGVLRPLKVIITNYPEGKVEQMEIENNPEDETQGKRLVPFSREIFIERDDFMENPPNKFFRLAPGREVRLKGAYIIKCTGLLKDNKGEVSEVHCTYEPETRSGGPQSDRKVKGTLHWVSAEHALDAEVRLYDRLFNTEDPAGKKDEDYRSFLNPDSLEVLRGCKVEPSLATAGPPDKFQFQRLGYFCVDNDSTTGNLVFNRTVGLKDTWAKLNK
ncbi:MAG: glutamine--tRNA ligase/YqeY domain fusion protein [Bacteroidales bacterium]|jgi:glutaminyl-tRNA synthetase|nr:glutamine--tRNA ligase/YqeY domain fusion protein [Bacteroidales bacterium]MDI9532993.1 glutamine--tRNA ligase/YqeY domain fusion protein [Bacteroidota bacterium]MBP7036157.1 glutamine--tRNA ligase/YqeY domain fusion protein [Bacteroidales bacterium]MBP8709718.1 glutamine--tRNA ligase/YqeY domain fusion protein [Bacteroidales bacterium]HHU99215.1 glutamine--tRNA ligase/YqeY domain fusion protein [Bacteroidales bacterium]